MESRVFKMDAAQSAKSRGSLPEFCNEAMTDFTKDINREAMRKALELVDRQERILHRAYDHCGL